MPPDGSTDHERAIAKNGPQLEAIKAASTPGVAEEIRAELSPDDLEALKRYASDNLTQEIVMRVNTHADLGELSISAALKSPDPKIVDMARIKLNDLGAGQ